MSLTPAFELGLWNAWIITVIGFLSTFMPLVISKEIVKKRAEGEPSWSELNGTVKIVIVITHVIIMPFTIIYSIFLPLKLGTIWLYVGLPISIIGIVMSSLAGVSFATAPLDRPMTEGVYGVLRHPMYFGGFLEYLGIGIACASWVFMLCAVIWIITWNVGVSYEEHTLIERYRDAYREYMDRTPRWLGIPK